MKLPKEIKGRNKIRDFAICRDWINYLDDDENTSKPSQFKTILKEQYHISYRYINKILARNSVVLKPDITHEKNKRYWKLKLLAKGKDKSNKDITDILEQQRREVEGDKSLIDLSQHTHLTKVEVKISDETNIPLTRKAGINT